MLVGGTGMLFTHDIRRAGVQLMFLNVALAQIDIAFGAPQANLLALRPLVATAAARGAALLVLPELWSTGYDLARAAELADAPGSGIHAELAALAREQQIAIAGSTLMRHGAQITNTATLYGPDGTLLLSYDKLHLFGLLREDRYLAPGSALALCDAPWGRTALGICYDLRFPEQWRACALQGATLLLVPAEWPTPRRAHWRVLVQARAIENQCFVVAANRVGSDPETSFGGHSLVVGPGGEVLAEGGETAELLFARLDMQAVPTTRAHIRMWDDRRPDVYAAALSGALATPQGTDDL
jgi:predicted amidohydrolase